MRGRIVRSYCGFGELYLGEFQVPGSRRATTRRSYFYYDHQGSDSLRKTGGLDMRRHVCIIVIDVDIRTLRFTVSIG